MNVEGRAHAHHEAGIEPVKIFGHKALLLGSAQSNPEDIGSGVHDQGGQLVFFLASERPEMAEYRFLQCRSLGTISSKRC